MSSVQKDNRSINYQSFYRYLIFGLTGLVIMVTIFGTNFNRVFAWGFVWIVILSSLLFALNLKQERMGYFFASILGLISVGLLGPEVSILGFLAGGIAGYGIARSIHTFVSEKEDEVKNFSLENHGFEISIDLISMYIVYVIIIGQNRLIGFTSELDLLWLFGVLLFIVFLICSVSLRRLDQLCGSKNRPDRFSVRISIGKLMSILFAYAIVMMTFQLYPIYGIQVFILSGILLLLSSYFYENLFLSKERIARKEKELQTLDQISHFVRSSIVLDDLLEIIKDEVFNLIDADNFYVALLDEDREELWYPIAVRDGMVKRWPRRHMMSRRLTDRVIQSGEAILFSPGNHDQVNPSELPPSIALTKAWLGVPLITSKGTIGCIAVFGEDENHNFYEEDLNLLTMLSNQVSTAIENALLYGQVSKRAEQFETLSELTRSLSTSLQIEEVLDEVCISVIKSGNANQSAIYLLDERKKTFKLAKEIGLPESILRSTRNISIDTYFQSSPLIENQPKLIEDYRYHDDISPEISHEYLNAGIFASAIFPLISSSGILGLLAIYYEAPHQFRQDEVDLLSMFASQAAISISNAMLHSQTDRQLAKRVQQLSILEEVSRELSAAVASDRLYQIILDHALEYTGAPSGAVDILDPKTGKLLVKATRGYSTEIDQIPTNEGIVTRILYQPEFYSTGNVERDKDFLDLRDGKTKSQITAPLLFEGRMLGSITLESDEADAFSRDEEAFLSQLANQSAIAVQNAELYAEIENRLAEQSTLYDFSMKLSRSLHRDELLNYVFEIFQQEFVPRDVWLYLYSSESASYQLIQSSKPLTDGNSIKLQVQDLKRIFGSSHKDSNFQFTSTSHRTVHAAKVKMQDQGQSLIYRMVSAGSTIGLVVIDDILEHPLSDDQVNLGASLVNQAAIALQNANLFHSTQEDRDRVTSIINSIQEGIVMLDSQGIIVLCNQQISEILGIEIREFVGTELINLPPRIYSALGINDPGVFMEEVHTEAAADRLQVSNYVISDGKRNRHLERLIGTLQTDDKSFSGLIIVIRDVTDEVELDQARELITTTLIHDLRSPMSTVIGSLDMISDLIQNDIDDQELLEQSIHVAKRSTKRVINLVEDLLDISGLSTGTLQLEQEPVDIIKLMEELIEEYSGVAKEYGIGIQVDSYADLEEIQGDYKKIYRVFANILDNALKFTPEGGKILVKVEKAVDHYQISISDSGPGVPEEFREKIFDEFSQIPGLKARKRGTGLGLAFCKLAVEAHGGRIWVEDADLGGSRFVVQFPESFRLPI